MNLLCPHCHQRIGVSDNLSGQTVGCPLCKKPFTAPRPPANPTPPPAPVAEAPQPPPTPSLEHAKTPALVESAHPRRGLTVRFVPGVTRWVVAGCFLLNFVLLFLPWAHVLIPISLTSPDRPIAPLKDLVLIVDCSASMNESLPSGDAKIHLVQKAASDLIDKLPDSIRFGLVLYGRDRETPCKVEVIRKLGLLDAAARTDLKKVLAEAAPSGQAPMGQAIKQAGEELSAGGGNGGVVLITDGLDTCGEDPSGRAGELARRPALTYGVNIIGLGVSPKDQRALQRTAKTGKGTFHDAETGSELRDAIETVLSDAKKSAEQEHLLGAFTDMRQTGARIGFGAGAVSASYLMILYFLLTLAGLLLAVGLVVLGVLASRGASAKLAPVLRLVPWLTLAVAGGSFLALVLLLLQMLLGFPVENDFSKYVFTYRTTWLSAAVLMNVCTMLACLLLFRLERQAPGQQRPRLHLEW